MLFEIYYLYFLLFSNYFLNYIFFILFCFFILKKTTEQKIKLVENSYSNKSRSSNLNQLKINSENNDLDLNSSKTIEAMKSLGYSSDEIIYVPFKEFINIHQDIKNLPKEIQKQRYDFYEKFRQKKIQEINSLKDKIDMSKIPTISNDNLSSGNIILKENISSTAVNDCLNYYNNSKNKNENEFLNAVEYQLEKEINKKENELKLKRQNFKDKENKKKKDITKDIGKMETIEKEYLKRKYEEHEELERKRRNLEYYMNKQEEFKYNQYLEEEKEKQLKEKNKEIENNREKYREKVEKMNEEFRNKIKEKALSLGNKHYYLEKELEKIRKNKMENNKLKFNKKRETTLKNMRKLENIKENNKRYYEIKQEIEEEKQKRFNEKKLEEKKEKLEEAKLNEDNIQNVLKKDKLIQQKKKERILNTIEIKQKMTEQVLNDKNNELLKKNEENKELDLIKQNNIKRMQNIKQNQRDNKLIWIINKAINFDKFEKQKNYLNEQLNNYNNNLKYKKEIFNDDLNRISHLGKIDDKTKRKFIEMFSKSPRIENLIKRLIELENEEKSDLNDYNEEIKSLNSTLNQRKKIFRKNINVSHPKKIDFKNLSFEKYLKTENYSELDKSIKDNLMKTTREKKIRTLKNLKTSPNKKIIHKDNNSKNEISKIKNYTSKQIGRNTIKNLIKNNGNIKKNENEVKRPKKPFCLEEYNTNQNTASSIKSVSYLNSNRSANTLSNK